MNKYEPNLRVKILRNAGFGRGTSKMTEIHRERIPKMDERIRVIGENGFYEIVGRRMYLHDNWKDYGLEPPLIIVTPVRNQ
jgi:hypothetical protein